MAGLPLALLLASAAACSKAPAPAPPTAFDLGDTRLARIDALLPFARFDGVAGSILTGSGWSRPGPTDDPSGLSDRQVEAVALDSEVLLPPPPAGPTDLLLRCSPYRLDAAGGLTVEAWSGDTLLGSDRFEAGWGFARIALPDALFARGDARLSLRFGDADERARFPEFSRRDRPHWAACSLLAAAPATLDDPLSALATLPRAGSERSGSRLERLRPPASLAVPLPPGSTLEVALRARAIPGGCAPSISRRRRVERRFEPVAHLIGNEGTLRLRNTELEPIEALIAVASTVDGSPCPAPGGEVEIVRLDRTAPATRPHLDRPNVLFYLVDTLRADAPELAPRAGTALLEFARRAVRYRLAWSPASWTLPAVTSLFTGELPFDHGVLRWDTRLPRAEPRTLAERFAALGYQTLAVSQTWLVGPDFGLDRGFDEYFLNDQFNGDDLRSQELRAFLRHWYLYRSDPARPLFAYFHSVDSHGPYSPPEGRYRDLRQAIEGGRFDASVRVREIERPETPLTETDAAAARALYLGEVEYTDEQFGRWLAALSWLDLDPSAMIALLSDHGEAFGEGGRFGHGRSLNEEQNRVPLVVRFPGGRAAGQESLAPVSTLDLVASALALAGDASSEGYRSRLGLPLPGEARAADWADAEVRPIGPDEELGLLLRARLDGTVKCVLTTDGAGRPVDGVPSWEWFLVSARDVLERPLDESDARVSRCMRALRAALSRGERKSPPSERFDPDAEQIESLRAVGYL